MRTLIFTCLCVVLSQIGNAQLDCIDGVTTAYLPSDGLLIIYPQDFLLSTDPNAEYLISFNGGLNKASDTITIENIGTNNYVVTESTTGNTCEGEFIVSEQTDNTPPIPICNDVVTINLDITNRVTIDDIDEGSRDQETAPSDLIRSLSLTNETRLNPSDEGFMAVEFLEFTTDDICESFSVILNVWDEEGAHNMCWMTVQVIDNLSLCDFNDNILNCADGQTFYVDDNQGITLNARFFSFQASSNETLLLSIDNGPFVPSVEMTLANIGPHDFVVSNIDGERQCSGTFDLQEICTTESCPNKLSFQKQLVSPGDNICISASGMSENSLASIQTGITWDPNVLRYTGIRETGTLLGITVNEADIEQGELRFLWIVGFSDDPLEGDFGFDICFEVIGNSGDGSFVSFTDLPGFRFEAASGSGATFPMILQQGQVCIDTCPDGNGNSCYSFDQGQCATDEFANQIDSNGTAEEMADQMKAYLESKSFTVADVRVIKNYHEASCQACGICPEPHKFFVKIASSQHNDFLALELLNAELSDCSFFDRPIIQQGEIPLYINGASVDKDESVIRFTLNEQSTNVYDNGTYGLPQANIIAGTNELSIKNSTGSILNGISTLDIVMTLQYILGLESLMPHQMIAADIDKSGDISITKDITKMSNLILGIDNNIEGSNWFFIPESEAFGKPFDFDGFDFINDFDTYKFLDTDINPSIGINVDVYKYGDLNRNFALNRSTETGLIRYDDIELINEEVYNVEFSLSSENIGQFVGAQAAIAFEDIEIQELSHSYGNALNYVIEDNIVKFTIASTQEFEDMSIIIQLKSKTQNQLQNLLSISESMSTEFILSDLSVFNIELAANDITSPTIDIQTLKLKVFPNPASENVNVVVPAQFIGENLRIYNAQGQLEYTTRIEKEIIQINSTELISNGLKIIHVNGVQSQKLLIH